MRTTREKQQRCTIRNWPKDDTLGVSSKLCFSMIACSQRTRKSMQIRWCGVACFPPPRFTAAYRRISPTPNRHTDALTRLPHRRTSVHSGTFSVGPRTLENRGSTLIIKCHRLGAQAGVDPFLAWFQAGPYTTYCLS